MLSLVCVRCGAGNRAHRVDIFIHVLETLDFQWLAAQMREKPAPRHPRSQDKNIRPMRSRAPHAL
jgi:hypothetical protein